MFLQIILVSLIIKNVHNHTPKNNSDVYITYQEHSELGNDKILEAKKDDIDKNKIKPKTQTDAVTENYEPTFEDIVFVPNEKPIIRNEDLINNEEIKIDDLMNRKYLNNVMEERKVVKTDSPNEHVLFITGKNKEDEEFNTDKVTKRNQRTKSIFDDISKVIKRKVNCSSLDCNNNQDPVCGGKAERNKIKYRLFLNECFFDKVNCAFKYNLNKYRKVNLTKCEQVAALNFEKPTYKLKTAPIKPANVNNTRRTFSSRRSLMIDIDGKFCSHSCPVSCTDDYDPRCAITSNGQMRVFANHCKLDFNSCLYRIVWHARPLSHCVGGRKADMQQNRRFISWMQQAGIVDKRGRLSIH
ncbi:PREDICTED: uncharacterized protein LOC106114566 [Papilio xuthus]|uniref:Uncharacterized protein LOC106114566 n=1 Tax=Papilio xuthus TaxID=66420 RepID=A0AAJ6Z1T8_PAPXU|nr:PREDICTED: uncharacterized protein LOC106114566 [Papilio xuthus]